VHLCAIPFADKQAQDLYHALRKVHGDHGDAIVGGEIAFTFGGGPAESPNVIWIPDRDPEKKGAPEVNPRFRST
jgi:hypothetical protein